MRQKIYFQPNYLYQQGLYIIEVNIVEIGCKIEDRFTDIIKSQLIYFVHGLNDFLTVRLKVLQPKENWLVPSYNITISIFYLF